MTLEIIKLAQEILEQTEQREEALEAENYSKSFEIECDQRGNAEALAILILEGKK